MDGRFFKNNRTSLTRHLGAGLIVVSAYTKMQAAGDAAHPFKQEANFWYLSGIKYPDWWLVIDGKKDESWLIAPEVDVTHQIFDGSLSVEAAKKISGVDGVLSQKEGKRLLKDLAKKYSVVHTPGVPPYAEYADFVLNPAPERLRENLKRLFNEVKDCQAELARLRAVKQPEEITAIKAAAELSAAAFKNARTKLASSRYEYEVEAEMAYTFRRRNATHAFDPIVASGQNACTLHYVSNSSELKGGEMLLIDAGAKLNNYSADITRTFAIREPTKRGREVHEAVQRAKEQIVALIKPGLLIGDYVTSADDIMKDALLSLGLMKDKNDLVAFRRYFPHAVSHGLGLDIHEGLGGYKEFMPGMVLTVEPGIYISEEDIGVRIEDDILVTESSRENLTAGISTDL